MRIGYTAKQSAAAGCDVINNLKADVVTQDGGKNNVRFIRGCFGEAVVRTVWWGLKVCKCCGASDTSNFTRSCANGNCFISGFDSQNDLTCSTKGIVDFTS